MARDLEHFSLAAWKEPLPRRKQGGGGGRQTRGDRRKHGDDLEKQAQELAVAFAERRRTAPQGINPKNVFKLQLNKTYGDLDEDLLGRMGMHLLARNDKRAVVVFPESADLEALRQRIAQYSGRVPDGSQYAELDAIEEIVPLGPEDRRGARIRQRPLEPGETAPLDVELWHGGDIQECRRRIREIRAFLEGRNLRVTDDYVGTSLCLLRAQVTALVLDDLLAIDYVKEVDRRPEPSFELLPVIRAELDDLVDQVEAPAEDLIGVLVVDSGVAGGHPLLGPVLGDAQVFPDPERVRVRGGAEDAHDGGHGTGVAGIAVYSDVGECIATRAFRPTARLFSARVTDENNEYDPDTLIEHQLQEAVAYFLNNYPAVRVINISLGDERLPYEEGSYQFRFAAMIDELAYQYRDREVLFVVSAGNAKPMDLTPDEVLTHYPRYLLEDPRRRIIDPATAAIALTVGGLAYGSGRVPGTNGDEWVHRLVAGDRGYPSPFTRTGWGINGAIKPEVVEFAGDWRYNSGRIGDEPQHAGIPSASRNFAPPEGRLFRTVVGTSFAAPRVANLAARLFRDLPGASSNLVRALIASSAKIPEARPPGFETKEAFDPDALRLYGYGQPDYRRARFSAENDVLLLADEVIGVDSFRLFTVPALPREFLTARGKGYISVTLAFDPPTRHTRSDSYLGVRMEAKLFRNSTHEAVADAIRALTKDEAKIFGKNKPTVGSLKKDLGVAIEVDLRPGVNARKVGTLQRGIATVSNTAWQYDGGPLILAVVCQRKWAQQSIETQRFAVVVSLSHDDPGVNLHAHVRQHARMYQRARVQV